jgi:hypothetical protein
LLFNALKGRGFSRATNQSKTFKQKPARSSTSSGPILIVLVSKSGFISGRDIVPGYDSVSGHDSMSGYEFSFVNGHDLTGCGKTHKGLSDKARGLVTRQGAL